MVNPGHTSNGSQQQVQPTKVQARDGGMDGWMEGGGMDGRTEEGKDLERDGGKVPNRRLTIKTPMKSSVTVKKSQS